MPLSRDRPHRLRSWREWLRGTLDAAFMDLLPWLLMSWIGGSGRVLVGACVGLLLTALAVLLRGLPWRLLQLEALATVTFCLFLVMALLAPASSQDWLAEHADQLSDSLFMAFVLGGNLLGRPFTEDYARMELPEHLLRQAPYRKTMMVLAWVWFAAFALQSAMGLVADLVFDQPDELWWGWLLPLAVIMAAMTFTEQFTASKRQQSRLSWRACLIWFPTYLILCSVMVLTTGAGIWLGVLLLGLGLIGTRLRWRKPQPSQH